jgi:hypothetical protein
MKEGSITILDVILSVVTFLLILTLFLVSKTPKDNSCYRYVDYTGNENYMDWHGNLCQTEGAELFCREDGKMFKVSEYERTECPKEE